MGGDATGGNGGGFGGSTSLVGGAGVGRLHLLGRRCRRRRWLPGGSSWRPGTTSGGGNGGGLGGFGGNAGFTIGVSGSGGDGGEQRPGRRRR